MELLDFSASPPVRLALYVSAAVPLMLMLVARLPFLRERNAPQFLVSQGCGLLLWILLAADYSGPVEELATGFMVLLSAALLYLEAWLLISRGYTLGVLATLLAAGRPLRPEDIAARYRADGGLSWIMHHRLDGLMATGLVRRKGNALSLTPAWGVPVARFYRLTLAVLGLRGNKQ